jgi:eukaryotic-like serine/threonine-protein kinase
MELLRGEPLTNALSRRDLTVREVLDLLLRAMRGVSAAHRQGVVHRDLKPDNIFLAYEEDGVRREPKVLDFGISKVSNEGQINPRLTRTGAVVGTPYYMSPEQIRGSDNLDRRADVYSFGVILYEALTGQVPFIADTYGALVLEIATGTPKTPSELVPGLPEELSYVVLRAMARNAPDRFADMEALIHALEPFLSDTVPTREATKAQQRRFGSGTSSISTPFTAEPPPGGPKIPRGGKSAMVFVAGALALVVAVWFVVQLVRTPELPIVAPATTVQAVQPEPPAKAPPAAASGNAPAPPSGTLAPTLPLGASTPPPDPEPFAPKEKPPVAADTRNRTVRPTNKPKQDSAPAQPPAAAERPEKPERPQPQVTRRARSGPLSVDEF